MLLNARSSIIYCYRLPWELWCMVVREFHMFRCFSQLFRHFNVDILFHNESISPSRFLSLNTNGVTLRTFSYNRRGYKCTNEMLPANLILSWQSLLLPIWPTFRYISIPPCVTYRQSQFHNVYWLLWEVHGCTCMFAPIKP